MMDSHVLRKASYRLPALADLAVLRFNTRGTIVGARARATASSATARPSGYDVAAAIGYCVAAGLPRLWLLGWSFGTELALMWGNDAGGRGRDPALARAAPGDRRRPGRAGRRSGKPLIALVPELDDYLRPDEARARFARVPQAEVIAVEQGQAPVGGGDVRPDRAE